jgi:hypothetical protein
MPPLAVLLLARVRVAGQSGHPAPGLVTCSKALSLALLGDARPARRSGPRSDHEQRVPDRGRTDGVIVRDRRSDRGEREHVVSREVRTSEISDLGVGGPPCP